LKKKEIELAPASAPVAKAAGARRFLPLINQ
jgi:hypothetical protein